MKISKDMDNLEIANLFRAISASYQIEDKDGNKFKIIAYDRAADAIEHLSSEAKDLYDDGKLGEIPGVGESISNHLKEIFHKGKSKHFEKILMKIPESVFELIPLEGIGPKLAFRLVKLLKIEAPNSIEKLKIFAQQGKIQELEGFGEDSQKSILNAIIDYKGKFKRYLLNYAEDVAVLITEWMKNNKYLLRIDTLGSLRRKDSTIGDIDLSCSTNKPHEIIKHFVNYPNSIRTLEEGERKASIIIPGNIQVDLRVQEPKSYGSLLQHFTGSKHHNIKLREYAMKHKSSMSLSEYGITRITTTNSNIKYKKPNIIQFSDELSFYNYLNLDWIPPELREDNGEIEASLRHELPKLVENKEIKGDLQIHSNYDTQTSHDIGLSDFNKITQKSIEMGYEYIAITDHNPSLGKHTDNQIFDIIKRRKEVIDQYNYSFKNLYPKRVFKLFNSLEIDILKDGKLPISERVLQLLDFALVSIHSGFRTERNVLTANIINALDHPKVKIFAHPTGRKLGEREGVDIEWENIFAFCNEHNKWIEINGDPMRLDLPDYLVKEAVKNNILLTLGTDSHHVDHMNNMKYAIYVARRGWAEKRNIINTRSLEDFEKMLL